MKRGFKIAAIVVGVLIVLLAVAPFLIPVNQFRPTIEQKASAALGRKVESETLACRCSAARWAQTISPSLTIQNSATHRF